MNATGNRDQGTEGGHGLERLLRRAVPPVAEDAEGDRDLWPAMRARLHSAEARTGIRAVPWFDWALAAGVALFAVAVPTAVPVLLYYL